MSAIGMLALAAGAMGGTTLPDRKFKVTSNLPDYTKFKFCKKEKPKTMGNHICSKKRRH